MKNPTVSKADLEAFLLPLQKHPDPKKRELAARTKADRLWYQLLMRCHDGGSLSEHLVVRCPECEATAEDCKCRRKLYFGKNIWKWSEHHDWVIERQSLVLLKPDDLMGVYMMKSTRQNVMNFVDHLKAACN